MPFHVLADYDADDVNDKFLDSTGRVLSRSQLWNESLAAKINEFKSTFQKQVHVFATLSKRRAEGEARGEEGLMFEQFLLQDEKQKVMETKKEFEREREERARAAAAAAAEKTRIHHHEMAVRQAHQAQAQSQSRHLGHAPMQNPMSATGAGGGVVMNNGEEEENGGGGGVELGLSG